MPYVEIYQYTHARWWLEKLLEKYPEHNKGLLYLERFCEACELLKSDGLISGFHVWPQRSSRDKLGVDVTIDFNGKLLDYQVTSSFQEALGHIQTNKKHPERGEIRIVYVREGNKPLLKSVENLEREILRKAKLNFVRL